MAVKPDVNPTKTISRANPFQAVAAFTKTKFFHLLIVVALAAAGYLVAPDDLQAGNYSALITVQVDGETLEVTYPFTVGSTAGEETAITQQRGDYQIIVAGPDAFKYELGQRISYEVSVLDANGNPLELPLDTMTSVITGPGNYNQTLPPTERTDTGLQMGMRVPFKSKIAMGLLFAVAALWLLEPIPLAASALLIPVVIVVTGVTSANVVLQPFFHPIIVLFLAGFLMAEAMRRAGIDRMLALAILRRAKAKPAVLMLVLMGITAFLSMWMSNTASVAIIIPIALAVINKLPGNGGSHKRFSQALILGVAYAGAVGGIGSAIGTPANILALTFLGEFAGTDLAFVDWFAYGLPIVLVMVPVIWVYLLITFRVKKLNVDLNSVLSNDDLSNGKTMTGGQRIIGVIFIIVILMWLTESWHGIPSAIVALIGALALFLFEMIQEEDLNKINWNALITFGGGMAIGSILVTTGVSDWIALQLVGLSNLPPMLVIFLVAALTVVIGALISNTACAAMLIPLAIPLAQILHLDPRLLVAVVAIASSIDFALVIGTPPTMLAYSTGFFETSEIFKRGIVLDVIGVILLSFGVIWIWQILGSISLF